MPEFRDVPLTQYVKMRLRALYAAGKALADLEDEARVSARFFSQVLGGGSGVGPKSGDGIARIFGMKSYDELHVAAYEWWTREGKALYERVEKPETHHDPEVTKAIDATRRLVSPEVITTTLATYPNITGQPWDWWVARFAETQRTVDARLAEERRLGRKAKRTVARKRRAIRDVADKVIEKRLEESEAAKAPSRHSKKTA